MVEYIKEIIVPYVESVRSSLNKESATAIVIMDNFRGQKTEEVIMIMDNFRGQKTEKVNNLLEENNLHVCLLLFNTTDKLHLMDVAINKPAKDFLRRKFEEMVCQPGHGAAPSCRSFRY